MEGLFPLLQHCLGLCSLEELMIIQTYNLINNLYLWRLLDLELCLLFEFQSFYGNTLLFSRLIELKCIFLHSDVIRFMIHAGTLLSTQLCVCEVRTLHVVSWSLLSIYLDDYHCFIFSCFGQIKL